MKNIILVIGLLWICCYGPIIAQNVSDMDALFKEKFLEGEIVDGMGFKIINRPDTVLGDFFVVGVFDNNTFKDITDDFYYSWIKIDDDSIKYFDKNYVLKSKRSYSIDFFKLTKEEGYLSCFGMYDSPWKYTLDYIDSNYMVFSCRYSKSKNRKLKIEYFLLLRRWQNSSSLPSE